MCSELKIKEISRTAGVSALVLTCTCIAATLTITLTLNNYQALMEFPTVVVGVLYMLYCAVLLARHTKLPVYGHAFFWVWITGSVFRQMSYWIMGPLYAASAGARGNILFVANR